MYKVPINLKSMEHFSKVIAENKGTVLRTDEKITVPYDTISNVIKTKDISPLKPNMVENTYYPQNIGKVKAFGEIMVSQIRRLRFRNSFGADKAEMVLTKSGLYSRNNKSHDSGIRQNKSRYY